MSQHLANARFSNDPTDDELESLVAYVRTHPPQIVKERLVGTAECPHCIWPIEYAVGKAYFDAIAPPETILACGCGHSHRGHPPDTVNCGFRAVVTLPVPEEPHQ
jgi:hypothetical protein